MKLLISTVLSFGVLVSVYSKLKDECLQNNGGCHESAYCVHTNNGELICRCSEGYVGNGLKCIDIDECEINNGCCHDYAACKNTLSSWSCSCTEGFTGNGFMCTDINECQVDNGKCDGNATCTNTPGSRTCVCNVGFTGDGIECTDINECGSNPCQNGGTCTDEVNGYECKCVLGWTGDLCENRCVIHLHAGGISIYRGLDGPTPTLISLQNGFNLVELNITGCSPMTKETSVFDTVNDIHTPRETDRLATFIYTLKQSAVLLCATTRGALRKLRYHGKRVLKDVGFGISLVTQSGDKERSMVFISVIDQANLTFPRVVYSNTIRFQVQGKVGLNSTRLMIELTNDDAQ